MKWFLVSLFLFSVVQGAPLYADSLVEAEVSQLDPSVAELPGCHIPGRSYSCGKKNYVSVGCSISCPADRIPVCEPPFCEGSQGFQAQCFCR